MAERPQPSVLRDQRDMGWIAQFEGQMLVCGLLAKALYGPPDRTWIQELKQQKTFDGVPFGAETIEMQSAIECFERWTESIGSTIQDADFEEICGDHTRLFIGPQRLLAAPWESVYTNKDRAVFQTETQSVKNWYARFEMALTSEYNEPADHIGLEFSFLAELSALTLTASEIRDGTEVKRLIDAQRGFLNQHVLRWVHRWAADVVRHARTDFYRGLAWLARGTAIEAASFFSIEAARSKASGAFQRDAVLDADKAPRKT